MTRKSSTETLIAAMRILARDIKSGDGVANAAISEAADRLEEQQARIAELERLVAEHVEVDRQWDVQRVGRLCGVPPGGSIRQAIEPTLLRLAAQVAELEAKAAIGRRAVEMLRKHQHSEDISLRASYCPECDKMQPEHAEGCELATILRDANGQGILDSSAPKPATVAVDAGALGQLRSAMSKLRAPMSRTEYAAARASIIEAAYRLLAGGVE